MKIRSIIIPIGITLLVVGLLTYGSVEFLGEYGWTVFILVPLLIGFLPPYFESRSKIISFNHSLKLSFLSLGIACLGTLIFAFEGLICIAMALPILGILTLFGSYVAYTIQKRKPLNRFNFITILLFVSAGFLSFDIVNEPVKLIPVKTRIIVNAPIGKVWKNVVTFDKIDSPVEWIFKTGIAYPIDATIEGKGVGAIRYCNFTTGSFVEPITKWEEPNLLQFDVIEQPLPMNEYNPFWEIHPPHLKGYFQSYKGQFSLKLMDDTKTELEGTTWYKVDIMPEFYWKIWSDFIIHRIHKRVLNHIKKEAEK